MNKHLQSLVYRFLFLVSGILMGTATFAQGTPETYDMMRGSGKIYVVVAICLTILLGLFIYVFIIDRKISRLEKDRD